MDASDIDDDYVQVQIDYNARREYYPGSLEVTSKGVANMMRRWNYVEGSGLGAQGQGIIIPVRAAEMYLSRAGIGYRRRYYDNGLGFNAGYQLPSPTKTISYDEDCYRQILEHLREQHKKARWTDVKTALSLAAVVTSTKVYRLLRRCRKKFAWDLATPPISLVSLFVDRKLVVAAIEADLESWSPTWDPCCYHWLRRWIPLIGHLPEHLYDAVERKITAGNKIAYFSIVSPWKVYLSPAEWSVFAGRHVNPTLTAYVRELKVTPPRQTGNGFRAAMKWSSLVPASTMEEILEAEHFFDRWEQALRNWLASATPSLNEALAWCYGWKSLFTPELLDEEGVLARVDGWVDIVNNHREGFRNRIPTSFRTHGSEEEGCACWWCSSTAPKTTTPPSSLSPPPSPPPSP